MDKFLLMGITFADPPEPPPPPPPPDDDDDHPHNDGTGSGWQKD